MMHYNEYKLTNEFSNSFISNFYLPYIIQLCRHTSHPRNHTDNIFSNVILKDIITGNITTAISRYLDLPNILNLDEQNIELVRNNFLDTMNAVLKYELKCKRKPWINSTIRKPISIENKLLKAFIHKKS